VIIGTGKERKNLDGRGTVAGVYIIRTRSIGGGIRRWRRSDSRWHDGGCGSEEIVCDDTILR
jgi:hypothetical protein